MPRNPHWGTLLVLVLSGLISHASAQSHNFGYYEETYRDSNKAIYDLVWSEYVSGIENEPEQPEDFYIPPDGNVGGGGCSSAMDPECTHPQGSIGGGGEASIQSSDGITDRITVYYQNGGAIGLAVRALVAWSGDSSGGGGFGEPGSAVGRGTKEDPPPPCNAGDPEIDGNQNVWTDMWDDTNVAEAGGTSYQRERFKYKNAVAEQVGFLYPNGQFQNLKDIPGAIDSQDACGISIIPGALPEFPPGTIFVHTHPWANGDDQVPACGPSSPYQNGPGKDDREALQAMGIDRGLVLDLNGIYSYKAEESDDAPGKKESDVCY